MGEIYEKILAELLEIVPDAHKYRINIAIELARASYEGEIRLCGETLFEHAIRSALVYAKLRIDVNGIIATLFHHRLSEKIYKENSEIFTDDVCSLLDHLEEVFSKVKEDQKDQSTVIKYILSFSNDVRVALIKLSEKVDSARTIVELSIDQRDKSARRLLSIYAPLSEYLNLSEFKNIFENTAFAVLQPEAKNEVEKNIATWFPQKDQMLGGIAQVLAEIADIVSINTVAWGRVKSPYSIWRKLRKYENEGIDKGIAAVSDLLAFTIVVDTIDQCYAIAYAIMAYATVSREKFEDYIQQPKPNGFRQIQMVCSFPEYSQFSIEVQVLTREMYWHNTYGPASHIAYKLEGKRFAKANSSFQWIEDVHTLISQAKVSTELPEAAPLKGNWFHESIFVFTPQHQIVVLPKGATVIDFAYQLHTDIGNKAVRARVNGELVALSKELASGDEVDVIIDASRRHPSKEWLLFAKTKGAISRIKRGLRAV